MTIATITYVLREEANLEGSFQKREWRWGKGMMGMGRRTKNEHPWEYLFHEAFYWKVTSGPCLEDHLIVYLNISAILAAAKSLQSCLTLCNPIDGLPHPRDSPGKNTGVGCHFLLQCMKVKSEGEVAQSCLTLSDPVDCSLPGSSIHGIFQARVLEWVAIAFSICYPRYLEKKKKQLLPHLLPRLRKISHWFCLNSSVFGREEEIEIEL